MKTSRFYFRTLGLAMLLALPALFHTACQPVNVKQSLMRMDTLQTMMNDADGAMLIDEDAIAARYDSMDVKLKIILAALPDSGNSELKSAIIRYAAIRSNYAQVLKDYPVLNYDVDKEKEDVKVLRQALVEKELSSDVFDNRYREEKTDVEKLQSRIKEINYSVFAVEQDYRRMSDVLNPLYHKLKK